MNDLEAIRAIAAQMAFALRPFAELAAPLVDQKVSTAIGLKEVDFENARLALHQWNEALPTIDWNNLDRARVAKLEAALKEIRDIGGLGWSIAEAALQDAPQ